MKVAIYIFVDSHFFVFWSAFLQKFLSKNRKLSKQPSSKAFK